MFRFSEIQSNFKCASTENRNMNFHESGPKIRPNWNSGIWYNATFKQVQY